VSGRQEIWKQHLLLYWYDLGPLDGLVEVDETFLGKRKYEKGQRQRKNGAVIYQTAVEVEENDDFSRHAKRARAVFTPDKTKESFETNLTYLVAESADGQSDSHKSYSGLRNIFHSHEMVNHRKEWVRPGILRPVTTNTIESDGKCPILNSKF